MEQAIAPGPPAAHRSVQPAPPATSLPPTRSRAPEPLRLDPSVALGIIAVGCASSFSASGGPTRPYVSGFGDWLTNAGRLTGLLAGYCVVVLVALMARLPPLENGLGADRLARWHSMGGRYTVSLIVAHALLITWGYAVTAHTNVVHQGWTLLPQLSRRADGHGRRAAVRRRRHQLDARGAPQAALRDLVLPALLHLPRDRARVQPPVRRRRRVHAATSRLASSGRRSTSRSSPRSSGTGSSSRSARNSRHQLRVVSVVARRPTPSRVLVTGEHLHELAAQPGQFFRWRFLTKGLWWASNPYSLSAPGRPDDDAFHGQGRWATTAARSSASRPAPASSPKARTARSPAAGAPSARCC